MRWSILFSFGMAGLLGLVLVNPGLGEDPAPANPNIVQIDISKLPPEVAKRLLDELAKQKKPEVPAAAGDARGKGDGNARADAKAKGGEKPSKGKAMKGAAPEVRGKGRPQAGKPGENDRKPEGDKKPEK
ncbi:hypothetical protein AYO44_10015 [Planctomycetaceae bacterium SCGC AG-212-F19]|nr:hypothetical protein AYO44_10015 [Planctomycetaceae bacterium SCGC AG-212-F19]